MTIESLREGIAVLDSERHVMSVNARALSLTGLADAASFAGLLATPDGIQALAEGNGLLHADGRALAVSCEACGPHTFIYLREAAGELEWRGYVVSAARAEALGRLSEGMAHDARNPLNAIALNIEVLGEKLRAVNPEARAAVDRYVKAIKEQVGKVDVIIRRFVSFARPDRNATKDVDLAAMVEGVLEATQHLARKRGVIVDKHVAQVRVSGDSARLSDALLQLVLHGIEGTGQGGTLHVNLERRDNDAVLHIRNVASGDAVKHTNGVAVQRGRLPLLAVEAIVTSQRGAFAAQPQEVGEELVVRLPAA